MSLQLSTLSPGDDADLSTFLNALAKESPSVLAYHYPFYRDMLEGLGVGQPNYLGVRRSGRLCGYLPVFVKQSNLGTAFCSLPYFGPNAGVLCSHEDRVEVHELLLKELLRLAEESHALSCSVYTPFLSKDFALYESSFEAFTVVDKFTQYLDLSTAKWSPEIRNRLRRAQRASISVTCEADGARLKEFYDVYQKNCAEYDIPVKPWMCIEFLADQRLRGRYSQIYMAILEDKVIAGLLVLFSPTTVSYYIPCSLPEYRGYQPLTLLIDRAAEEARARGLAYWNWESAPSRESGVYTFKKRWGAREEPYRIYVKTFQSKDTLREIGRARIAQEFPYFFVWPFDRL